MFSHLLVEVLNRLPLHFISRVYHMPTYVPVPSDYTPKCKQIFVLKSLTLSLKLLWSGFLYKDNLNYLPITQFSWSLALVCVCVCELGTHLEMRSSTSSRLWRSEAAVYLKNLKPCLRGGLFFSLTFTSVAHHIASHLIEFVHKTWGENFYSAGWLAHY